MMKKLFKAETAGFIFVSVFGTLSHFVFEMTGQSRVAALFCPVNESVFEHLKMIYFPFLLYTAIEYFILKRPIGFFVSKLCGAMWGMIFTVAFFYTYSGIIGHHVLIIDILIFLFSVFIAFFISYTMIINPKKSSAAHENAAIIALILITAIFFIFTFSPPFLPVFRDSVYGTYGI